MPWGVEGPARRSHGGDAHVFRGKELYVDATKVKANASLDSLTPRFAVEAHLTNLFAKDFSTG